MDQKLEDDYFQMWLHSQSGKSFKDWKRLSNIKPLRQKKAKIVTKTEEKQRIEFASKFINFKAKEGEPSNGSI